MALPLDFVRCRCAKAAKRLSCELSKETIQAFGREQSAGRSAYIWRGEPVKEHVCFEDVIRRKPPRAAKGKAVNTPIGFLALSCLLGEDTVTGPVGVVVRGTALVARTDGRLSKAVDKLGFDSKERQSFVAVLLSCEGALPGGGKVVPR